MKKYRYVEFTDEAVYSKSGLLYIVAENPETYIEEFGLIKKSLRGKSGYCTTLEKIGALGWELAFVTPCGSFSNPNFSTIQNAYVFKKEIEE